MNERAFSRTLPLSSLAGLVLLGVLSLCSCGCIISDLIFGEVTVEPRFDCRYDSVLVVPFREGKQWYCDSRHGLDLYRSIFFTLQSRSECGDLQLVGGEEIQEKIATFAGEQPPWGEFGKEAGATVVIFGAIKQLSLSNPNMIGMLQGKMDFKVQVFSVEENKVKFTQDLQVAYPKNPDSGQIAIDFEQNEDQVRRALYGEASNKIADLLCGFRKNKDR